ncbi:uncharacterized protein LOC121871511 [Homarus americanus]|uniref:uncharacterized protein LOC121871511 n=1 Tax=Homarus americanus TaxID=6706 RepID=UPI001C477172|nr:uncharacterized protein LOC121871511 [Homarus americanus]
MNLKGQQNQLGSAINAPRSRGRTNTNVITNTIDRRRSRSLTNKHMEGRGSKAPGYTSPSDAFVNTKNAMKTAMTKKQRSKSSDRLVTEGHVMGGGRPTGGEEHRRKPRSLPPLEQKPRSPVIPVSSLESGRFIGSPPPSGLRRDDNGNKFEVRRASVSAGDEEMTVYQPANPALEMSQPRITLNTAPRKISQSPPPAHAIVTVENALAASSSSLSLRSLASVASESLALRQALTPPPKLVTFRSEGGAEAVQEWVPDEDGVGLATPPRKNSSPSIRDLPSPMMGRHSLNRPPPPAHATRRTRSTIKLSPINK